MKLYYKPGACSLAVHIALREIGADFELEKVDTRTQKTERGADYSRISPNGYVPALAIDGDTVLTEAPAVLQYLADRHPQAGLAPPAGSLERARLQEHLNFTSSELHKSFSPFFAPEPPAGLARTDAEAKVVRRMNHVESVLADGRPYLLGERFSVADAYLFVVAGWSVPAGIGLERWPAVAAYVKRIAGRPPVRAAMESEELLH